MSDNISQIILDELRAHRKETNDGFDKINGRVRSLEETRAENRGIKKASIAISSILSGVVSFFVSHFYHN